MWSSKSNDNYDVNCYFWGWVKWEKIRWFVVNGGGSWGRWLGDRHESGPYGSRLIWVSSMVFIGHNGFRIGMAWLV